MQIIRMKESKDKNKLDPEMEEGSDLISYSEFYEAIKNSVTILPRTPSIQDVLLCNKTEDTYNISDLSYDDFVLFRYQMNVIYKKIHYVGDNAESALDFGSSPLSKTGGLELHRPPGIVKQDKYMQKHEIKSQLPKTVWNAAPSNKIYVKAPKKSTDNIDDGKKVDPIQNHINMALRQEVARDVDFVNLFDTDFPPEFEELANDNKESREGTDKEKDIVEMRKKAEKRYKDVKNVTNLVSLNFQS
jgi:hypothetical protein